MSADLKEDRLRSALRTVGARNPDREILNWGIGGQSSFQIAARQGAIPWTAEVVGGVIPASGSVELVNHRTPLRTELSNQTGGKIPTDLHDNGNWLPYENNPNSTWVEIDGVFGEIVRKKSDAGGKKEHAFFFIRKDAGIAVRVVNPVSIEVVGTGPHAEHRLEDINKRLAIIWAFGPHLNPYFRSSEVYGASANALNPTLSTEVEMEILEAMIEQIASPDKRYILLDETRGFPPPSHDKNLQNNVANNTLRAAAYRTNYPEVYFDFAPLFATGLGDVPPAKQWLRETYPNEYNDPVKGWLGERQILEKRNGRSKVTPIEPAAVAKIVLLSDGGSGVKSVDAIETKTEGSTRFLKTGLRVGVQAKDGVATALAVREGGRGYTVGDIITIPPGAVGNAEAIKGKVAELRKETLGTVRHPDGAVDTAASYSQWDLDNGYIPRVFRRDIVHYTPRGAEYLSLLLAEEIKRRDW